MGVPENCAPTTRAAHCRAHRAEQSRAVSEKSNAVEQELTECDRQTSETTTDETKNQRQRFDSERDVWSLLTRPGSFGLRAFAIVQMLQASKTLEIEINCHAASASPKTASIANGQAVPTRSQLASEHSHSETHNGQLQGLAEGVALKRRAVNAILLGHTIHE